MFPTPAIPAIAIMARTKRIIRHFNQAGAYNQESAINPGETGLRKGLVFERLVRKGILIESSDSRYYIDFENLQRYRALRAKRISFIFILLISIGLVGWLISRYK